MLLKRLVKNLPPQAGALIPLLGRWITFHLLSPEPQIQTTQSLLTTKKAVLLGIIVTALSLPDSVDGARTAAAYEAALDVLLEHCNSVDVHSGLEVYRADAGSAGWDGLGVLGDVVEWDGKGVLALAGGKGCGKSVSRPGWPWVC